MGGWLFPTLVVSLPAWVGEVLPDPQHSFASDEEAMEVAIQLSRLNVERGTGGPFGAVIVEITTQRLVAAGVNLVPSLGWSGAHAEMVAIAMAQKSLAKLDLGAEREDAYALITSTEPCAMCLGCVTWSGLRRLVCGAADADARAIGFDEGIKASDWPQQLRQRGIAVRQGVCGEEAVSVLRAYQAGGGLIYNGRTTT